MLLNIIVVFVVISTRKVQKNKHPSKKTYARI